MQLPVEVRLLGTGLGYPGDVAGRDVCFDLGNKVMAEESNFGHDSDEVLTHMREDRHKGHGIWCEVEEIEPICVHVLSEKIREGGTSPQ